MTTSSCCVHSIDWQSDWCRCRPWKLTSLYNNYVNVPKSHLHKHREFRNSRRRRVLNQVSILVPQVTPTFVLRVSILGLLRYLLHTACIPKTRDTAVETFAEDTDIFSVSDGPAINSQHLQELNIFRNQNWRWLNKMWKPKTTRSISSSIIVIFRTDKCPIVTLRQVEISPDVVKYLQLSNNTSTKCIYVYIICILFTLYFYKFILLFLFNSLIYYILCMCKIYCV